MKEKVVELIEKRKDNFNLLKNKSNEICEAVRIIKTALENNNKVIFCGNGGSASDANHLACEFVSRFKKERKALPSISLCSNNSIITAIANDYSFDDVFKRQIEALGQKGDVLVAISTSGKSRNVIKALYQAKNQELKTILLTGENKTGLEIDLEINILNKSTEQIQEMHIALGHIVCELCEKDFN